MTTIEKLAAKSARLRELTASLDERSSPYTQRWYDSGIANGAEAAVHAQRAIVAQQNRDSHLASISLKEAALRHQSAAGDFEAAASRHRSDKEPVAAKIASRAALAHRRMADAHLKERYTIETFLKRQDEAHERRRKASEATWHAGQVARAKRLAAATRDFMGRAGLIQHSVQPLLREMEGGHTCYDGHKQISEVLSQYKHLPEALRLAQEHLDAASSFYI